MDINNNWIELHARAIEVHKRAFEAEYQRDQSVFSYWKEALELWGQLIETDDFWKALKTKGIALQQSLFMDDGPIEQLKSALPGFLLDIPVFFILNTIDHEPERATYHFELIRTAKLSSSLNENERFISEARQKIYDRRLRMELLETNDEEKFINAINLAEPIHRLDPTEKTAVFFINIFLNWIQSYEDEILELSQDQGYEEEDFEEEDETYWDIETYHDSSSQNDEIELIKEEQAEWMDDFEDVLLETSRYLDAENRVNQKMITRSLYFLARHHVSTAEEYNQERAIEYLEEALDIDPTNDVAIDLLNVILEQNFLEEY